MKYIELFAGIGGFRYGLEAANWGSLPEPWPGAKKGRVGVYYKSGADWKQKPYNCIYANEWDKYAAQIYRRHYGEIDTRDIRDVPTDEIPSYELLTAGFPCQDFSVAGKGVGLEGTRGTLFFEIARILAVKKPGHFLLENVKGLLSNQDGQTFQTILGVLTDLGYRVEWMVLNSKHFGVPQNRERVFIVGHFRGECTGEVFPVRQSNRELSNKLIPELGGSSPQPIWTVTDSERTRREILSGYRIRRLTPVECERLQDFPDGWTEGVSDTQRYKCLGNAVTTSVVTAIGESLLNHYNSDMK